MKKKVNVFGKTVPVFALVILGLAITTAALLPFYGMITGNAVVTQSVVLEDNQVTGEWDTTFVAGKTVIDCDTDDSGHSVKNNADVVAPIQFGTTCSSLLAGSDDGTRNETEIDWSTVGNNRCDGIVTEIYGILELTSKDASWDPTAAMNATLKYTIVGNEFGYELTATGLEPDIGYVLIYYADQPERYVDWGGNPALNLGTTTSNGTGYLVLSNSLSISGGLPYSDDWNTGNYLNSEDEYADYCTNTEGDGYEHCVGAKIWLVPSDTYDGDDVTVWTPGRFLFETDLIMYSNDAGNQMDLLANGGGFNFCESNAFALNLVPDTYTIETKILPVTA